MKVKKREKLDLRNLIINQRERMQEDLLSILDGIDDQRLLDSVCDVVADRMNIILSKVE